MIIKTKANQFTDFTKLKTSLLFGRKYNVNVNYKGVNFDGYFLLVNGVIYVTELKSENSNNRRAKSTIIKNLKDLLNSN